MFYFTFLSRRLKKGMGEYWMIINSEFSGLDEYRQVLQRFAWRIQYHARKQINREVLSIDFDNYHNHHNYQNNVSERLKDIQLHELIQSINSEKGRYIIQRIYIDGLKEKEVADELQISQQAVSKWKKKSLDYMKSTMELEKDVWKSGGLTVNEDR
ncbi:DUF1492 domain-containing protein [Paenibacillus sp. HWE-109]|uniref:DUF1492 domain-containing protein n=1 Tax=Paenibacillus sp. HWE-109 TaxID=1306526 RepID=UPI001EDD7BC5|nr:DUF1492 domain-containing protein [Paenibacillus sp. HWE-109]UKS25738.1 DUF1492 domain-containing protein [Paenibacillus sp. HWE-109]